MPKANKVIHTKSPSQTILIVLSLLVICICIISLLPKPTTNHTSPPNPNLDTGLLLTWHKDPTSSIVATWTSHSKNPEILQWRKAHTSTTSHSSETSKTWSQTQSSVEPFPFHQENGNPSEYIHRVSLETLTPNQRYTLKIGKNAHDFQTLPKILGKETLTFLIGGDMMQSPELMIPTNEAAATHNPLFIIMGGDIAYDDGDPIAGALKWKTWMAETTKSLKTQDNRLLPIVACIGNHETPYGFLDKNQKENPSTYFNAFFKSPHYFDLTFGDYLYLVLLDTNHSNPITGQQTHWLENALKSRKKTLYSLATYHIPAYPSVRNHNDPANKEIRENWVPLFEKYKIQACFENHDHAYKRSHPLLNNKADPQGITYLGDGCWGVTPRDPKPLEKTPHLLTTSPTPHFLKATLNSHTLTLEAINQENIPFDSHNIAPTTFNNPHGTNGTNGIQ